MFKRRCRGTGAWFVALLTIGRGAQAAAIFRGSLILEPGGRRCKSCLPDHTKALAAEAKAKPLRVLVSNDDGVAAPGIDALVKGLRKIPKVRTSGAGFTPLTKLPLEPAAS